MFAGRLVPLKPLRQRKKDIPAIARHFLEQFSQRVRKSISGFSSEAMNALVDYDWPSNVYELRQVVDRAVALCTDQHVREEHIFLDVSPFSATGRVNLLKAHWLDQLVRKRYFPAALRLASIPCFIFLILYTFLGPSHNNLANVLIWATGWPLLIFSVAVSARSWCGYCPLVPISKAMTLSKRVFHSTPRSLSKYGMWLSIAGVVTILWAESSAQMLTHPRATGVLLLSILAGTVITALLFGQRAWCQHLCPLGRMVGQCATVSPIVLRSNNNVCATQCQTHDCIQKTACPMGLHPSAAETAHECVLCFSCVRHCSHKAVRLDLRSPWRALVSQRKWEFHRAFFGVLLVGTVLAVKIPAWAPARDFVLDPVAALSTPASAAALLLAYAAITVLFLGAVFLASAASGRKEWQRTFVHAGYAYLPLAFAAFFNMYFREFVNHGDEILPTAVAVVGLGDSISAEWLTPNLATLKGLFPLITVAGAIMSFYILRRIATSVAIPRGAYRAHQLILAGSALLFVLIL
jgi:hypothetical protein